MAAERRHTSPTRKMDQTVTRSSAHIDRTGEPHGDVSWNVSSIVAVPVFANHVDGFHRQDTIRARRVRAVFDHGQRVCFVDGTNSDLVCGVGCSSFPHGCRMHNKGRVGSFRVTYPPPSFLRLDGTSSSWWWRRRIQLWFRPSIHPSRGWMHPMPSFGSFPPSTSFDPTLCHGWVGSTIPSMGSVPFPVPPKTSFHLVP